MNERSFKVSAPGKIILFGEHAVVYGKRALAAAINLRTTIEYKPLASTDADNVEFLLRSPLMHAGEFSFRIGLAEVRQLCSHMTCSRETAYAVGPSIIDLKLIASITEVLDRAATDQSGGKLLNVAGSSDYEMMKRALIAFLFLCAVLFEPSTLHAFALHITTTLPLASGLGSSASFSVALCTVLLRVSGFLTNGDSAGTTDGVQTTQQLTTVGRQLNLAERELIRRWSFVIETMFHERPSGIDNAIVTFGGLGAFEKGEFRPLQHRRASAFPFRLLLVNTRVQRSTRDLVQRVRQAFEKRQRVHEHVFAAIGALVDDFVDAYTHFTSSDSDCPPALPTTQGGNESEPHVRLTFDWLNEQVRLSQTLLDALDVSHAKIEQVRAMLLAELGVRAKLTGAGGGGVVLAFLPSCTPRAEEREEYDKRLDTTLKRLEAAGFEAFVTDVGAHGVEFE